VGANGNPGLPGEQAKPELDPEMYCYDDSDDVAMVGDEENEVEIPIASFKSNHISKKNMLTPGDMSPTAMGE
jgi:hypothetical protein